MQLNAITRKSALPAILLLITVLVASAFRYGFNPYDVELAHSEFRERFVSILVAMLLFLAGGMIEGKMLTRSGLTKGYCTLPIPIFGVLACGVFVAPNLLATAVASFCLALALYLLLRSLHRAGEKDSVFFASVLLGLTVPFVPSCVVLVGVIPIAILTLALSVRQIFLMVVGYLLPIFGASYIVWYRGGDFLDFSRNVIAHLSSTHISVEQIANFPYLSTAMVALVVVVMMWGVVYSIVRPGKMFMLARVRRSLHLFVWVLALTLSMLLLPSRDLSACAIVAVPATILLSFVLNMIPDNHSTLAYWALLLLFVVHLFVP